MNSKIQKILYWSPRGLGLLFTVLMGLFATEAFNEGNGIIKMLISFSMLLIPALIILMFTLFSWKNEGLGAILFIALGLVYMFWFHGAELLDKLMICIPLYIIGILFLVEKIFHQIRKKGS